jgi:hypothetical protein
LGYLIAIVFIYSGFIGMWIVEFIHVCTAYHLFVKMPRALFERGDLKKKEGRDFHVRNAVFLNSDCF